MTVEKATCICTFVTELQATADRRDIVRRIKTEHRATVMERLASVLPDDDVGFDEFALVAALGSISDKHPEFFLTAREVRQRVKRRWTRATKVSA